MSTDDTFDEASAASSGRSGGELDRTSGTYRGAQWRVIADRERPRIVIDGREIHVRNDGYGGYITHEVFGRWNDLARLAQVIVRFHPDYSPLARRRDEPVA